MSERQALRWERLRRGGKLRFILIHGLLRWGVLTAVLAAWLGGLLGIDRAFIDQVKVNLIFFPLAGALLVGPLLWSVQESKYQRLQRSRLKSPADQPPSAIAPAQGAGTR